MLINRKRINKLDTYFKGVSDEKQLYVSVPRNEENMDIIRKKLNILEYETGLEFVPDEIGPVTRRNLHGEYIVFKDKEKEDRVFEIRYRLKDYHGNWHEGFCYHTRKCYQRELLMPQLETVILDEELIRSKIIKKSSSQKLKTIINIFLEIFGYCYILDKDELPLKYTNIKKVDWQIFPSGEYPWDKMDSIFKKYCSKLDNKHRPVIERRKDIISKYNPDSTILGYSGFNGYVGHTFKDKDIFIFESTKIHNATYVFKGKWEEFSKLTKRDIIQGKLCHKRIIHNNRWEDEINKLLK